MSDDSGFSQIAKKDTEAIRVARRRYEGHEYIDIRSYYLAEVGDFRPTKKGVTLPLNLLPELVSSLEKLAEEVK